MASRIESIAIPAEDQRTFAGSLRLPDAALTALEAALHQAVPTLERDALIAQLRVEPVLGNIADLESLVGALLSLAGTAYAGGLSVEEVIDFVVDEIGNDDVIDLSDSDRESLKSILARLAKTESIEVVSKARQLLLANDRNFEKAKIITDLRPVFAGDDFSISGEVIVHQLTIQAQRNGRSEATFVALDSSDLAKLHAEVTRALAKDKSLRQFAKISKTPILTPVGEEGVQSP
jgi:hypothetical protein